MVDVLIVSSENGAPMTLLEIIMLVNNYFDKKGVTSPTFKNNFLCPDWADDFLRRRKGKLTKRMSRAEKTSEEFDIYLNNLKTTLDKVLPQNIFNYGETNLSDNPGTKKFIFFGDTKYPEMNMNSTISAISIMFAATAAGDLLPCYLYSV